MKPSEQRLGCGAAVDRDPHRHPVQDNAAPRAGVCRPDAAQQQIREGPVQGQDDADGQDVLDDVAGVEGEVGQERLGEVQLGVDHHAQDAQPVDEDDAAHHGGGEQEHGAQPAGAARRAPEHDDGQPAHRRGGQQEPDDVAGGGAGEDAQPAASAAEDRQACEAQEQVQANGGEGPARAERQPGEHDGEGLQRDGHAESADGNGGDQRGPGDEGGENGDEAKVGGVPAVPAPGRAGCGGVAVCVMVFLSGAAVR